MSDFGADARGSGYVVWWKYRRDGIVATSVPAGFALDAMFPRRREHRDMERWVRWPIQQVLGQRNRGTDGLCSPSGFFRGQGQVAGRTTAG
jgi:hypothetical protein